MQHNVKKENLTFDSDSYLASEEGTFVRVKTLFTPCHTPENNILVF